MTPSASVSLAAPAGTTRTARPSASRPKPTTTLLQQPQQDVKSGRFRTAVVVRLSALTLTSVRATEDAGERIEEFSDRFLVRCPRCSQRATVARVQGGDPYPLYWQRRFTCTHCGRTDEITPGNTIIERTTAEHLPQGAIVIGRPVDFYFHLPLWLQTSCRGEILWATHEEHLAFLERYIGATLRHRVPNKNRSLANRLPDWMTAAKNRETVLDCLRRLKQLADNV